MSEIVISTDLGNGGDSTVSNVGKYKFDNPLSFEPIMAPRTHARDVSEKQSHPTLTLLKGDQVMVFGADDVFKFGNRKLRRRAANEQRYGSSDYYDLLAVSLLQVLHNYRGKETVSPRIIISMPIDQFNKEHMVKEIKAGVANMKHIVGEDGCVLNLSIDPKQVLVVPESLGTAIYYAYQKNLNPQKGTSLSGVTMVADIGLLTCNISRFENGAYVPESSLTVGRGGFNTVVYAIINWLKESGYTNPDFTLIDVGLRSVCDKPFGSPKVIDIGGGNRVDVQPAYDPAIQQLTMAINDALGNAAPDTVNRVLITGGTSYHIGRYLKEYVDVYSNGILVKNPAIANVCGAYLFYWQMLARKSIFQSDGDDE